MDNPCGETGSVRSYPAGTQDDIKRETDRSEAKAVPVGVPVPIAEHKFKAKLGQGHSTGSRGFDVEGSLLELLKFEELLHVLHGLRVRHVVGSLRQGRSCLGHAAGPPRA